MVVLIYSSSRYFQDYSDPFRRTIMWQLWTASPMMHMIGMQSVLSLATWAWFPLSK